MAVAALQPLLPTAGSGPLLGSVSDALRQATLSYWLFMLGWILFLAGALGVGAELVRLVRARL